MEDGQDEKQQPHLILAHKLFLLSHPDVEDIDKVRLRDEVLSVVKSDGIVLTSALVLMLLSPRSPVVTGWCCAACLTVDLPKRFAFST